MFLLENLDACLLDDNLDLATQNMLELYCSNFIKISQQQQGQNCLMGDLSLESIEMARAFFP